MKYFAFALLLATSTLAGRFQVKIDNGGGYTAVVTWEYYYPGDDTPHNHTSSITAWNVIATAGRTFEFPETAVNMSVRMWYLGGKSICRTLRRVEHDNDEELFFGGEYIQCSHNEHAGDGRHTVNNHGDGSVQQKHVFRWATKPDYNFQIRLKGTAGIYGYRPEVAAVQCREQHDTNHFDECEVIKCDQTKLEKILDTGTLYDSNYYYGQPGEHDYDPHTHFKEGRRFVRCDDPRDGKTDFWKFCGTSHLDIAMQTNPLPRAPTPNLQDRIAWVEVPPLTEEATRLLEREALLEREQEEGRVREAAQTRELERVRENAQIQQDAMQVQIDAMRKQMNAMREKEAAETKAA
jgi:hypothetical protein